MPEEDDRDMPSHRDRSERGKNTRRWSTRLFRVRYIRTRLLIAFTVVALLPVFILVVGLAIGSLQGVRQSTTGQLEAVAVLKEGEINEWLDNLLIELEIILSEPQVQAHEKVLMSAIPGSDEYQTAQQKLVGRLQQILEQTGRFDELFLLDLAGKVVLSTDPTQEGRARGNRPYFRQGLEGPFIQSPYYSPTDMRTFLHVSHPFMNEQGEPMAVLVGHANLDHMYGILAQGAGLGQTEETYLVGISGTLLTPTRNGKLHLWVNSEGIGTALGQQGVGSGLYQNYDWVPVVGAYRWLPKLKAALLAEQQQVEAFGSILTMLGIAAASVLVGALAAVGASLWLSRNIAMPLTDLAETATQIAAGDLDQNARVEREDEIGTLAQAFNSMKGQLRDLIAGLEQRVTDRTRELERRSHYLEASAQVSHASASILETQPLMQQVVELIREQFGLYYVGLFLVEQAGGGIGDDWAVLRAGTGGAGQAMMARGHRHKIGQGMIGWSIAHAEPRIALEAEEDVVRLASPELPDTRSEAALPLRSRGQVLGALTVQHTEPGAFDQDTLVVLQIMADQVAVALDNARLFAEHQQALVAAQRAYGELSRTAWLEILHTRPDLGIRSDQRGVTSASDIWRPEMEQALDMGHTIRGNGGDNDGRRVLAVPITVRGQVIGVLDTYKPAQGSDWAEEEVNLLEAIADQVGEALESARLYQETQRRAAREQAIRHVTERMRRSVDVESILQNTVAELAKALGAPRAYIRLGTEAELQPSAEMHLEPSGEMAPTSTPGDE